MTSAVAFEKRRQKDWLVELESGLILISFTPGAIVDFKMLKEIYDELNSDPKKFSSANTVWDFRKIMPASDAGYGTLIKVLEKLLAHRKLWRKQKKSALVVSSKLNYGLGRIYATLAEGRLEYEVKVFENDLEAALAWARSEN